MSERKRLQLPYGMIAMLAVLLLWQVAVAALHVPAFLLPSPLAVANSAMANWWLLASQGCITIAEIMLGFALSLVIGVPLALLLSTSRTIEQATSPLIVGTQAIPKIAIAPLLLAWFGFGLGPKVAIVALVAFFPIIVNTTAGLKSLSAESLYLARSMGATRLQVFSKFQVPNALPEIFAGMKVAIILSVIGAVVAEFVGADGGLGYVIMMANADFEMARQFAAIALLFAIGTILFALVQWLERICLPWHISVRRVEFGA